MKKINIIIYFIIRISSEQLNYEILFERVTNKSLQIPTNFPIPNLISSWNISFWFKINYINGLNKGIILKVIDNIGSSENLEINQIDNKIEFIHREIFSNLTEDSVNDFKNLLADSKNWFFFSLNYVFKKFQILFSYNYFTFDLLNEFLSDNGAKIVINNNKMNIVDFKISFAHVHFFKNSIPLTVYNYNDIKFYPKKIFALYKFSIIQSNDIIMNLSNFKKYRSVTITNNNKVPFKNYNSYVDVKINFPFFRKSIVLKNLIISIKGNIKFPNFIKSNNTYENIYWKIKWYTRKSEKNLNNFSLQSRISYSEITNINHKILFETKKFENDLNPNFTGASNYTKNIGSETRNNVTINILAIIQIKDYPRPGQTRFKNLRGVIPKINFDENFEYHFDLSFYDNHSFEIEFDSNYEILFYFELDEILVYSGNYIDEDLVNDKIYLGNEKKILIYCSEHNDLLRVYPNYNEKLILNECVHSQFPCTTIVGCAFCISNICQYCKTDFKLINNSCVKCSSSQILFENKCEDALDLDINEMENTLNQNLHNKVVGFKIRLESNRNFLDNLSETNKFSSNIYYPLDDQSNENPLNLKNLLNFENYIEKNIKYKIFDEISNTRNFNNTYSCRKSEFFEYNENSNFEGECKTSCIKTLQINNYCEKPLKSCLEQNTLKNRCNICKPEYNQTQYDINTSYCLPKSFETNLITNSENEISFLNTTCTDNNCSKCFINEINTFNCLSCKINFSFINFLHRCIPNSSVIENCIDFDVGGDQFCNSCDGNFFFYDNLEPYDCIDNSKFVGFCLLYSARPDYECYSCENDYFLFTKILTGGKICIDNSFFIDKCVDYDFISFECLNCENNYFLTKIEGNLSCLENIYDNLNCIDYKSLDFECIDCKENYKLITTLLNEIICLEHTIVNECKNYDPYKLLCIECNQNYILTEEIRNFNIFYSCIFNSNAIENCLKYDNNNSEFCLECNKNFFLFLENHCIHRIFKIEDCKNYDISNYLCLNCNFDFFLFEKLNQDFTKKNICIKKEYKIENCINYDEISYLCIECENNFDLVNAVLNKKICLDENSKIKNCKIYSQSFSCEKFHENEGCDKNILNCPICKYNEVIVNGECFNICSEEVLKCEICEQKCPINLCLKLIPFCLECDKNDFLKCSKCKKNFILNNGNCIKENIFNLIINRAECEKGCTTCFHKYCIECEYGYNYDDEKGICYIDENLIGKISESDYCFQENVICFKDGKAQNQNCTKCRTKCMCKIHIIKNISYLRCLKNTVYFIKNCEKYIEIKDIIIDPYKETELKMKFKNNKIQKSIIQIPKYLVKKSIDCSFDNFSFYKIENELFIDIEIKKEIITMMKYGSSIIPFFTSVLSNGILAYFLMICQIQEIFSYLFLIDFNGGRIFNYINSAEFNLLTYPDVTNEKNFYEKKFIFKRDHFFFIIFLEFPDICLIICFFIKEVVYFFFILAKTFYYYILNGEVLHNEYFSLEMFFLKRRIIIFFKSFMTMLSIKHLPKSKKFFIFHNLFFNNFVEIAFFIFYFLFISITFCHLKDQFDFTRQNENYEDIQYDSEFVILKKKKYRTEDNILNRFIITNYLMFFFRSYILQNYFENPTAVKIIIFTSFVVYIIFCIFILVQKNRIKKIIFCFLSNEIIFLGYFILGLDFFEKIVPDIVLNVLYLFCYVGKFLENCFLLVVLYFLNKVQKVKIEPYDGPLKNFVFEEGLKIKIDKTSIYFKKLQKLNIKF